MMADEFSQLGLVPDVQEEDKADRPQERLAGAKDKEEHEDEEFIKHPYFTDPSRIKAIHCSRWSTIIEMHDP